MVTIKGKDYEVKYNLKALFLFEEIAGKVYEGIKTIESYMLLFAMIMANNDGFDLTFDEFIECCNEDPRIFRAFGEAMKVESDRLKMIAESDKKKADE